jgi:hypothetical protein
LRRVDRAYAELLDQYYTIQLRIIGQDSDRVAAPEYLALQGMTPPTVIQSVPNLEKLQSKKSLIAEGAIDNLPLH